MSETTQQAYVRGVEMGKIVIRLDHHDEQIDATNALLARTVDISQTMASTVQTLTQTIVSDAATRVAVAEAVKDAEDTQDAHSRAKWTPLVKFATILGALVGVLGILWTIFSS